MSSSSVDEQSRRHFFVIVEEREKKDLPAEIGIGDTENRDWVKQS